MKKIFEKVEKYDEVKSTDNKQLGVAREVISNEIVMDVYVGRRGKLMIPKEMISEIKAGEITLNLTRKEFEAWWKEERPRLEGEYFERSEIALGKRLVGEDLELLREEIKRKFEENFGVEMTSVFLKSKRCPYCGFLITENERLFCYSCGLYFMRNELGEFEIPVEQRRRLLMEQEEISQSFSSHVRNMLRSNEWIYYFADLYMRVPRRELVDEDVFLITSERVIRYKSDGTKKANWEIPIDLIVFTSVSRRIETAPWSYGKIDRKGLFGTKGRELFQLYLNWRIDYRTGKGLRHKRVRIPMYTQIHTLPSPSMEFENIGSCIGKVIAVRKIKHDEKMSISDYSIPDY
ncbi:MAG: hypothetical protein ACFE7E_08235 [Candidatus Hodarchaeota archaeon]